MRTVWINRIAWNVFENLTVYSCLFEIELSICIEMDLALNNLQKVDMP